MATRYDGLIIPRSYNEYINKSDGATIAQAMHNSGLVPAQASSVNQLADKAFVNSSIGTNTANYISDDGEPFTSLEDLEAYTGTVTNNDYAFVTGTDDDGNTYYDRYKATVSGSSVTWAKEYRLNNSSFTAVQWAAIMSGITAQKVDIIDFLAEGYTAECDSAADAANKVITIADYYGTALPKDISVVFNNGNTYGDTTLQTPESVTASFYNADGDLLNANPLIISDSRGHNAGKGFCNAGDTIDLRNGNGRARITNSDVRQADTNYTIKSDGSFEQSILVSGSLTYAASERAIKGLPYALPLAVSNTKDINVSVQRNYPCWVIGDVISLNNNTISFELHSTHPQSVTVDIYVKLTHKGTI